jgi:hypothetical protein
MPSFWSNLEAPVMCSRLAVYQSSPATTLTLPGIVRRLQVVESFGSSLALPGIDARFGDPLIANGITIWLEGYFPTSSSGEPVVQSASDLHTTWNSLRSQLQASSYEFFTYYLPGALPFYRKYKTVSTALLKSQWADPLGITWLLAATTSDKTISLSGEGGVGGDRSHPALSRARDGESASLCRVALARAPAHRCPLTPHPSPSRGEGNQTTQPSTNNKEQDNEHATSLRPAVSDSGRGRFRDRDQDGRSALS